MRTFLLGLSLTTLVTAAVVQQPAEAWSVYADPQKRFTFRYPSVFGVPETGTDDGAGDRVAAVRFRSLIGVEAVLTKGAVTVDRQALGGLYDVFARQAIPDSQRVPILAALAPVSADSFCTLFGRTDHLVRSTTLSEKALQMARAADALGNVAPKVVACTRVASTVTFDKEAGLGPGASRRRVYGAIRFLPAPYSSFQIVGFGPAPAADLLAAMTTIVDSFAHASR